MKWIDLSPPCQTLQLPSAEVRDRFFSVAKKHVGDPPFHIVSVSLFGGLDLGWTREQSISTSRALRGSVGRVVDASRYLASFRKHCKIRVYLDPELDELTEELLDVGCEVFVMESSSPTMFPGALWRLLAIGERKGPVTILQSWAMNNVLDDVDRTDAIHEAGLGIWRMPYSDVNASASIFDICTYMPIYDGRFGCNFPLEMPIGRFLSLAVREFDERESPCWTHHSIHLTPVDSEFERWFLKSCLYYLAADFGILTLLSGSELVGPFLSSDIEYMMSVNTASEVIIDFFHPTRNSRPDKDSAAIKQREDSTIFIRERYFSTNKKINRKTAEMPLIFMVSEKPLIDFLLYDIGGIESSWIIDLGTNLKTCSLSPELFCDRSHASKTIVVSSFFFIKVSAKESEYAREMGLRSEKWAVGGVISVPKVDGCMTLWNRAKCLEIARQFSQSGATFRFETYLAMLASHGLIEIGDIAPSTQGWIQVQ